MNDKQINAAQATTANADAWKAAVDHELTALHSTADSFANPREAVRALIDWHISVERDPAVNEMARDAARYRLLRRKVRLAGGEFHIRNLDPRYVGTDSAVELDAAIDQALGEENSDA